MLSNQRVTFGFSNFAGIDSPLNLPESLLTLPGDAKGGAANGGHLLSESVLPALGYPSKGGGIIYPLVNKQFDPENDQF